MKYSSISEFSEGAASYKENGPKASSLDEVFKKVRENDVLPSQAERPPNMKRIKVKSNSERSNTQSFGHRGELVLRFDSEGVASFPSHQLELMQQIMRSRPGRYMLLEQEISGDPMPQAEALEMLAKLKEAEEQAQADKEAAELAAAEAAKAELEKEEADKARLEGERVALANALTELPPEVAKNPSKSPKAKAKKNSGRKSNKKEE